MVVARALRATRRRPRRSGQRNQAAARPRCGGHAGQRQRHSLFLDPIVGRQGRHDPRPNYQSDARANGHRLLSRRVCGVLRCIPCAHGLRGRGHGAGRFRSVVGEGVAAGGGACRGSCRGGRRLHAQRLRCVPCHSRHAGDRHDRTRPHAFWWPSQHCRGDAAERARSDRAMDCRARSRQTRRVDAALSHVAGERTARDRGLSAITAMSNDALQQQQAQRLLDAWRMPTGWRYWSAVNNTVVGLWYVAITFLFFLFGGVLALLMRWQLPRPDNAFLTADQYNQIFTLHGSMMMFLFAIPIFESVSILFLPAMIGARELPFPRVSAFGFWAFAIGGLFLCGSIFFDAAPQGGWFMYPPLSSRYQPGIGADIWLLGFSFIEVAAIAAAVELIVGVLCCRAPGMRLNLIPLYAWYVLVAGVMVVFAFPPLIAGTILLEFERAFGWPFFDPAGGGDPLLWQHLFWIFGHPEVYIIFLPSVALIAMIVPTAARRAIVGYSWIVLAAIGTGFLSFGLWVHHMFTTGLPGVTLTIFSAASMAVAIPTGIQFFCFIATLLAGRIVRSVPMLFIVGGLSTFVIGGLTGVMVAMAPFNFQAHDTYFVVAHLHTVLIAGAVFPVVAGIYYYYPLALNKLLSERLGRIAFWLIFTGFNATFLPMHLTGLMDLPRRVFTYPGGLGLEPLNLLSTVGAFVLALGF